MMLGMTDTVSQLQAAMRNRKVRLCSKSGGREVRRGDLKALK